MVSFHGGNGFGNQLQEYVGDWAALGLGEAVTFPAITAISSRWIPLNERARAQAWNLSGMALSLALAMPLCAWIISSFGWRWTFYSFGVLGFIWTAYWLFYAKDNPEDHRSVNSQELDLIRSGRKTATVMGSDARTVLSKGPVWALSINYFFQNYSWYLYLTWLPGYLVMARKFSIIKTGIYGMLPFIGAFIATNIAGFISDWLISKVGISKARNYIMYAAFGGSGLFMYLGAMAATGEMAILWITLSVSCVSMNFSSFWALPIDIGPKSAGLISGLMNTFGTIAGIIAPIVTGWIVATSGNWQLALGVAVTLAFL